MDTHDKDLADGINATLTKDGTNSPSAHLNWLSTERNINSSSGSSSNYTASLANAPSSYFTGLNFKFIPNHSNTGASTINVNSLGAKNIKVIVDSSGTKANPAPANVCQGYPTELYYDGTDFILINPPTGIWSTWAPTWAGSGSMTFTVNTTYSARYLQVGKTVSYSVNVEGTTGGTTSTIVTFTLPVTPADTSVSIVGSGWGDGAGSQNSLFARYTSGVAQVFNYSGDNWTIKSGQDIHIFGTYEAA